MNMFKKNGGFTLVELIVVIAILAILAGVAIPAYSGYIQKANEAADNQILEAYNTAIAAALAMEGEDLSDFESYFNLTNNILVGIDKDTSASGIQNDVWSNFCIFLGESADAANGGYTVTKNLKYFTTVTSTDGALVGSK